METIQIKSAYGWLRGRRQGAGAVFRGIPYAAPPVGPLRWRPPQCPTGWTGTRDALAFGPDAPQAPLVTLRGPRQDEDCLYLNVWTPTLDTGARLPVLVWVYGGGFVYGSGSDPGCDGGTLAAEGAVVVTFNYRLGLLGYLAHPALSAESPQEVSGNYGLLDQLAALAWVRDNIASFGGDPARITPFGVSAGAASLSLMLSSPQAQGLFQRTILHSPGAGRPLASLRQAEQAGLRLGTDLAALRALPAREVLARNAVMMPAVRGLTTPRVLRPIRDGWLLPEQERAVLEQRRQRPLPLLVGTNLDEGTQLTRGWTIDSLAAWREQVDSNFGPWAADAAGVYPARSDADARAAVAAMFADTQFNHGARLLARAMASVEPRTYKYLFTRRRPDQADGPHHSDETSHAFGTLRTLPAFDAVDEELSRLMRKSWVAFAAQADPNIDGLPRWQPYRPTDDNHLVLDGEPQAGAGWRKGPLDFLERFYGAN